MATQTNPVSWFEIPAADLDRAKLFYQNVFDVELTLNQMGPVEMAMFPMEMGGAGAAGALVKADGYKPSHAGSMVYFDAVNIEDTLKKVNNSGGKTLQPKMSIGEHGFIAHFEDCEGNRVSLHSMQ